MLQITAIKRRETFSPNRAQEDTAILERVVENLRDSGIEVEIIGEDEALEKDFEGDAIISMARDAKTVEKLKDLEDKGFVVINSGYGIQNCSRETFTQIFLSEKIPTPESYVIETDKWIDNKVKDVSLSFPCWLKKGEGYSETTEDIVFCENDETLQRAIRDFSSRKIKNAVINLNVPGDLVKFYGVADTDFFYWYHPLLNGGDKFGNEGTNQKLNNYKFDDQSLKKTADKIAGLLQIQIYGGDAIIEENGDFKIIDFNDWPSFSMCREKAATSIAEYIRQKVNKV